MPCTMLQQQHCHHHHHHQQQEHVGLLKHQQQLAHRAPRARHGSCSSSHPSAAARLVTLSAAATPDAHVVLQQQLAPDTHVLVLQQLATTAADPAAVRFEPHVDSTALAAQLVVLAATAGAAAYWWLVLVPSARRTLAKEKRAGPLQEYLTDLQANPERRVERWFYTDWLQQLQRRQQLAANAAAKRAAAAGAMAAADAAPSSEQQQQQLEQPAEPAEGLDDAADEMPSFWSLDNPILATGALLAAAAAVSAVLS